MFARNFGEESDRIREMLCLSCQAARRRQRTPTQAAHAVPRGMGGCNATRVDLVPLCYACHVEAGEAGTSARAAFEDRYGVDLRVEADARAAAHPRPLGIRGMVDRWPLELEDYEREALTGWLRRRVEFARAMLAAKARLHGREIDIADGVALSLAMSLGLTKDRAAELIEAMP